MLVMSSDFYLRSNPYSRARSLEQSLSILLSFLALGDVSPIYVDVTSVHNRRARARAKHIARAIYFSLETSYINRIDQNGIDVTKLGRGVQ